LLVTRALCCLAVTPSTSVHRRASLQNGQWSRGPRADPETIVPVHILFAENGVAEASTELLALSDPESPSFGKYWSPQSVTDAFSLAESDIAIILEWVKQSTGLPPSALLLPPCKCRLDFNTTVGQLETLLETKYFVYTHGASGKTSLVCDNYRLPDHLLPLIDFITPSVFPFREPHPVEPLTNLDSTEVQLPSLSKRQQALDCSQFTTPQCLREWYRIPSRGANYTLHPNNTFGVFQPSWMSWIAQDMDNFFSFLEPHLVGQRPQMQSIAGGYYNPTFWDQIFSLEPNLDFQYTMSLVWPQTVTNIQVGDEYLSGNLNTMLAAYDEYYCNKLDPSIDPQYPNTIAEGEGYQHFDCGSHTPPKVISISYAWAEADFPEEYLRRQCNEYLKLGLQGVTVVASTGDEGTAGRHSLCPDPSSKEKRPFHISFPASCPWVTAVGGTFKKPSSSPDGKPDNNTRKGSKQALETVYNRLPAGHTTNTSSTGGFSTVFSTPRYQSHATNKYLKSERHHLANLSDLFNPKGRAVPDVSALAGDYLV
ncbi:peptidase S8/S53 domain-containing protein, partial [Podospora aff. communis PSN243]